MNCLKDTFDVSKERSQSRVMELKIDLESLLKLPIYDKSVFIAAGVQLIGRVVLKKNASVWYNSVLRADSDYITIGEGSNVQDGCILHCDDGFPVMVGNGVTIGHRVILHGCTIESNCLIGMGSTIMNGCIIGENSIIGANTLLTEKTIIPSGSLVIGSPGKVIRQLTNEQIESIRQSAEGYKQRAAQYLGL